MKDKITNIFEDKVLEGNDLWIFDKVQKAAVKASWISNTIFVSGIWTYKKVNGVGLISFFIDEVSKDIEVIALTDASEYTEGKHFTYITECDYEGTLVSVVLRNDKFYSLDLLEEIQ